MRPIMKSDLESMGRSSYASFKVVSSSICSRTEKICKKPHRQETQYPNAIQMLSYYAQ